MEPILTKRKNRYKHQHKSFKLQSNQDKIFRSLTLRPSRRLSHFVTDAAILAHAIRDSSGRWYCTHWGPGNGANGSQWDLCMSPVQFHHRVFTKHPLNKIGKYKKPFQPSRPRKTHPVWKAKIHLLKTWRGTWTELPESFRLTRWRGAPALAGKPHWPDAEIT